MPSPKSSRSLSPNSPKSKIPSERIVPEFSTNPLVSLSVAPWLIRLPSLITVVNRSMNDRPSPAINAGISIRKLSITDRPVAVMVASDPRFESVKLSPVTSMTLVLSNIPIAPSTVISPLFVKLISFAFTSIAPSDPPNSKLSGISRLSAADDSKSTPSTSNVNKDVSSMEEIVTSFRVPSSSISPSIVALVFTGKAVSNVMVCPIKLVSNSIVLSPPATFESSIACLKLPGPESFVFVTANIAISNFPFSTI